METLLFLASGAFLGILLRKQKHWRPYIDKSISLMIWALLFFLGISVGRNQEIINNIQLIGWKALVLTIGGIVGSIACSYLVYRRFFNKKTTA